MNRMSAPFRCMKSCELAIAAVGTSPLLFVHLLRHSNLLQKVLERPSAAGARSCFDGREIKVTERRNVKGGKPGG